MNYVIFLWTISGEKIGNMIDALLQFPIFFSIIYSEDLIKMYVLQLQWNFEYLFKFPFLVAVTK